MVDRSDNGSISTMAMDSHKFDVRTVSGICLTPPAHWESWSSAEALFARDHRSRGEYRHSQRSTDSVQDRFLHHTAPAVVPGQELT